MHKFKTGKFKGKTVRQAILSNAPLLYDIADWAYDKPQLAEMLADFYHVRNQLRRAPIYAKCTLCCATATSLTLYTGIRGDHGDPYFWCDAHEPWQTNNISPKFPIHFDVLSQFDVKMERKWIFKDVRNAIGIARGGRITAKFAEEFFREIPD